MKKFGVAALLMAFAVVAGDRAFGFSHDGVHPLSYSNIITPFCSGCSMYCPVDAGCGADIWTDSSGCHHYRCYGNGGTGCSACEAGAAQGGIINGTFTPGEAVDTTKTDTTNANTTNGDTTNGSVTAPAEDRSADAAPAAGDAGTVRFSAPPTATTEKEDSSSAPAAAKAENASASPPPFADLDEDDDTTSTDAKETVKSPAALDPSAKPTVDADPIKTLLDAAPADEK